MAYFVSMPILAGGIGLYMFMSMMSSINKQRSDPFAKYQFQIWGDNEFSLLDNMVLLDPIENQLKNIKYKNIAKKPTSSSTSPTTSSGGPSDDAKKMLQQNKYVLPSKLTVNSGAHAAQKAAYLTAVMMLVNMPETYSIFIDMPLTEIENDKPPKILQNVLKQIVSDPTAEIELPDNLVDLDGRQDSIDYLSRLLSIIASVLPEELRNMLSRLVVVPNESGHMSVNVSFTKKKSNSK